MILTIELPEMEEAAWKEEAARLGVTPEELFRQAAREKMQALLAGLKDRRVPQSLDEIKPRRLPPPGKTAMQMVYQQLVDDEDDVSDEEVRRALEELS